MKFLFALLLTFFISFESFAVTYSIKDAIDKKLVSCSFGIASRDTNVWRPSYYDKCMNVRLQNLTKSYFTVSLETGYFVQPEDSGYQRMIITQDELISMAPSRNVSRDLYAMCTQMSNHGPDDDMKYALASKADGSLLGLVQLINAKHYQSDAAQNAVWVLTDGSSIGNIYSDNSAELKDLQNFVTKATGLSIPKQPNVIKYNSGVVTGTIYWESLEKQTLSLFLMRQDSTLEYAFFEKKVFNAAQQTLNWKFTYKGFPAGVYYVMLIDDKQKVISKRPFIVN